MTWGRFSRTGSANRQHRGTALAPMLALAGCFILASFSGAAPALGTWTGAGGSADAPPPDPTPAAALAASPGLSFDSGLRFAFPRFLIRYSAEKGFRVLAAPQAHPPASAPVDVNSVARRAYDSSNNWLRVENSAGQQGIHTPNDANQVFGSIFDSANNAIHVNCVSGCGATFGTDILAVDSSHQKVVGWNGIPLGTAPPTNGQVYTYSSALNQWVPGSSGSQLPAGTTNTFLGWSGTAWSAQQPSFSNLTGTVADTQLGAAYSGIGACPANQFSTSLARNAAPHCASAVTASGAPANQFATGISANGALTYTQPAFTNLTGVATPGQLPGAGSGAQGAITLAKDLGGTASLPQVTGLQGNPVQSGTPAANQVLTWNGSAWAAMNAAAGGAQIAQDLGGSLSAPQVIGIQGRSVSSTAPASNQFLGWNTSSSQWQPALVTYSQLSGVPPALPPSGSAAGDLSGSYPNPTVAKLNGGAIPSSTAVVGTNSSGQVVATPAQSANLFFASPNGSAGAPTFRALVAADIPTLNQNTTGNATTATALAAAPQGCTAGLYAIGIAASGNASCSEVTYAQLSGAPSALPPNGSAAGDLSGSYPNPTVAKLNGGAIPSSTAVVGTNSSGQVVATPAQSANLFFASPNGSAGAPAFRALVAADVPTLNQNTTGNAATATALVAAPQACGSGQYANGIAANGNAICGQVGFANLSGTLALGQTPLTTNGDFLTVAGGTLSRVPIGSANQCLQVNAAGTGYQFGACGTGGGGSPGGSNAQVQFNNSGSFGGAANFTYNTGSGAVSLQPSPSQDAVPLTLAPSVTSPAQDIFDVFKDSGKTTKAVWVDASGNLNFGGNNATYGASGQSTASHLNLFGGAAPNAGSYLAGTDSTGAHGTYLYFDPTAAGTVSLETGIISGAATASNRICTAGNGLCGTGSFGSQTANYVFAAPNGSSGSPVFRPLVAADIPMLNQSTTGNAATATALAATPQPCAAGSYATGIVASGNASCSPVSYAQLSGAPSALPPNGSASGDLSGSYPNPTVAKLNGGSIPASTAVVGTNSSGQVVATPSQSANTFFAAPNGLAGAPTFRALVAADIPTLNQNTTGNADTATALAATPQPCAAGSYATGIGASGNASCSPVSYAQLSGTPSALPPNGSASGDLSGGYPNPTVAKLNGGTIPASAAVVGTNSSGQVVATPSQSANLFFASPNGSAGAPTFRALVAADVPTLNQTTTGNAATATALASAPSICLAGQAPLGISANGNATGCWTPSGTGSVGSGTASHLTYYNSTGTAVGDMGADFTFTTHTITGGSSAILDMSAGTFKADSIAPDTDGVNAVRLFASNGTTAVLDVDTTNTRLGINTTPSYTLDVGGTVNATSLQTSGAGNSGIAVQSSSGTAPTGLINNIVYSGVLSGTSQIPCALINTTTSNCTPLLTTLGPVFGASGANHSIGAVPDPGSTAGTTHFLREDGTWQVPSGGGSSQWSNLTNPGANLALTMTGDSTAFNWAANDWLWDTNGNPTMGLVSTSTAVANSPTLTIQGSYQNSATPTYAADQWTVQDVVASGTNGSSTLTFAHSGSSGTVKATFPNLLQAGSFQCTVINSLCLSASAPTTAVTLGGAANVTNNSNGADWSFAPARGTGSAAATNSHIQAAQATGISGSTPLSLVDRVTTFGKIGLTSGSATNIVSVTLGTDQAVGLGIEYTIEAEDATNHHACVRHEKVMFQAVSTGTTATYVVNTPVISSSGPANGTCDAGGATLTVSWAQSSAATSTISVTPTIGGTAFTPTSFKIQGVIDNGSAQQITLQ